VKGDTVNRRLGDYVRIRTGKLDANASDPNGAYPFFTCSQEPLRISSFTYDCECVLVAGNGDLNAKYYHGQFDAYQRTYIVESIDKSQLDVRYLFHFMSLYVDQLRSMSIGGVIKYIKLGHLTEAKLPVPPLAKQKRIAEVLDRAEALRAKRRAAIAQLGTLTQSIFLDLFGDPATNPKGWPLSTIDGVAMQVTDGEHLTPKRTTTGIKLLSARNIRDGYLDFQDVDYVGPEEYERIKRRCNPSPGDVLISCSGTIGRVALVETNESFSLVRSVALVRPKTSIVGSKFLEHYLRTRTLKARMLRRANASSQANLFQGQIRELPVYLPPVSLQQEFARKAASVEKLRVAHQTSMSELDALFAVLQYRAFRGELFGASVTES
jgi:type I restriction enzyme, S subunit